MALVYILKSGKLDRKYVGSTRSDEIIFRLSYHNAGRVRSTKAYKPWVVVYTEKYVSYTEARKRELFLKSGVGRAKLNEIIKARRVDGVV